MRHIAPISGVASFGDDFVATAGYDNQLILWDAREHLAIACVNHDHLVNSCAFNSNGNLLVSASSDYSARIWEVPSMRLHAVLRGHSDDVEMAAFEPGEKRVATCSRDHSIRVFDIEGRHISTCVGHSADVISVAWNPMGQELVSSSDDGTVRCWRADDGVEVAKNSFDGVETDTIALTPSGLVFAGDDEGKITVLQGESVIATTKAHEAGIKRLVYSSDRNELISLSYDRKMKLWSGNGGALISRAEADLPPQVWPRSCTFLGSDKIVFATFGSTYAVLDLVSGKWELNNYEPSKSINTVLRVGESLLTVGDSGLVRRGNEVVADMHGLCNFLCFLGDKILTGGQMGGVHNAITGEIVYQHRSPLNCACAFSRNAIPHVAIGSYTGDVVILRENNGKIECAATIDMHENAIKGLATDGVMIFAVSANRNAAVATISDLSVHRVWKNVHGQIANGCAVVGPRKFCSVSRDLKLRIWSRDGIQEINTPHCNSIKCVATSGQIIATGDYGGRVAVYNLMTNNWLKMVRPSTSGISSIIYDPLDDGFLASCYDGCVYGISIEDEEVSYQLLFDVATIKL
jgi:toxoflavin biosynthesis protein ToxC